jgi:hypothetical protein
MKHLCGLALLLAAIPLSGCGASTDTETTRTVSLQDTCGIYSGSEYQTCYEAYAAEQEEHGRPVPPYPQSKTEPTASAKPNMNMVATIRLTSEEGYSATVELRRGSIQHAEASAENGALYLGSSCQVNDEKDAIEPFEITVTNTTKRYSASPAVDITGATPHGEYPGVSAEIGYSNGPQCVELNASGYPPNEEDQYLAFGPSEPLEPGAHTAAPGYLIIPNYYSPARPGGNPAKIRDVVLEMGPQLGAESFMVAGVSGLLHSRWVAAGLPVLPRSDGGCVVHPPCPSIQVGSVNY